MAMYWHTRQFLHMPANSTRTFKQELILRLEEANMLITRMSTPIGRLQFKNSNTSYSAAISKLQCLLLSCGDTTESLLPIHIVPGS